jgi:hypothetical protein
MHASERPISSLYVKLTNTTIRRKKEHSQNRYATRPKRNPATAGTKK